MSEPKLADLTRNMVRISSNLEEEESGIPNYNFNININDVLSGELQYLLFCFSLGMLTLAYIKRKRRMINRRMRRRLAGISD